MIDTLTLASTIFFTILMLHFSLSLYYRHSVSIIIGSPFLFFSLIFSLVFLLRPYVIIFINSSMVGQYSLSSDDLSLVLTIALISYFIIFCIYWLFQKSVKKDFFKNIELMCRKKFIIRIILFSILACSIIYIDTYIYGSNLLQKSGRGGLVFIFIIFKQLLFALITVQLFILFF